MKKGPVVPFVMVTPTPGSWACRIAVSLAHGRHPRPSDHFRGRATWRLGVVTTLTGMNLPAKGSQARSIVLKPRRGFQGIDFRRLWQFRELALCLALRDIQVRYKQTLLGAGWALIQPIAMMIALTAVRRFMSQSSAGPADAVFVFAAVLPWTFFAGSVTASTNSLVSNAHMLRKVYFPRLIVPVAAVGAPLLDYIVAFVVLAALMLAYGVSFTAQLALLPALIVTTIIAALGVGVLLSALTVAYRDFRYVVTLLVQLWFFATPVIYGLDEMPARYRWLMGLNPMGGTIEAFRNAVLGRPIDYALWAASASVASICLIVGLIYFSRAERKFADIV